MIRISKYAAFEHFLFEQTVIGHVTHSQYRKIYYIYTNDISSIYVIQYHSIIRYVHCVYQYCAYIPVSVEFVEVRCIPLGTKVNVREYLRGRIHLAQHGEHLLVDERFVFAQVHVQRFLQTAPDELGRHFVQVYAHHDFFQGTAYHPFSFFAFTGSISNQG